MMALYPWRDAAAASLLGVLWHFTPPPPGGHACRHLPFTLITLVCHDTSADGRTCRASSTPKSAASLSSTAFASAEKGGTSVTYTTHRTAQHAAWHGTAQHVKKVATHYTIGPICPALHSPQLTREAPPSPAQHTAWHTAQHTTAGIIQFVQHCICLD